MDEELAEAAQAYATRHQLVVAERLGFGIHGRVWIVEGNAENGKTALKVHRHEGGYQREKRIYLRLRDEGVFELLGFNVPELLRWDDSLLALEMTIVSPPYLLDFAGDYLDARPEFSEEIWEEWEAGKQEQFGDRWETVQLLIARLHGMGIYLMDPSPSNVRFA